MFTRLILILSFSATAVLADLSSMETKGDLESKNAVSCGQKLTNKFTPSDLFKAVAKCIREKKYADGIYPYMVGFAYGYYDQSRVMDISAHDAITALQAQDLGPLGEVEIGKFEAAKKEFYAKKEKMAEACAQIKTLGPPNYYPTYMIQHGVGAIEEKRSDMVPGFDAKKTWKNVLELAMKCK